jgi:hypothetical protein
MTKSWKPQPTYTESMRARGGARKTSPVFVCVCVCVCVYVYARV